MVALAIHYTRLITYQHVPRLSHELQYARTNDGKRGEFVAFMPQPKRGNVAPRLHAIQCMGRDASNTYLLQAPHVITHVTLQFGEAYNEWRPRLTPTRGVVANTGGSALITARAFLDHVFMHE